jgi:hypothetical protein
VRATIQDAKILSELRPFDVIAYLRSHQWREVQKLTNGAFWEKGDKEILLPMDGTLVDYPTRMAEVMRVLECYEGRSQFEIYEDLVTAAADIVRPRLTGVNGDGTISLDQGMAIHEAARDMMLAAACSTIEKKSLFARRKPEQAMNYLQHARFGIPRRGSYILTIISPVVPKLAPNDLFETEEPFERRTVETLAKALHAAELACREVATTGQIQPMKDAVASGVSANLCEALITLYRASGERGVQFSFSWTPLRGTPEGVVSESTISPDAIPFLMETARIFRENEPVENSEVLGTVIKLEREDEQQGKVTIFGSIDGIPRKITMELAGADHQIAIRSYKEQTPLTCAGTLARDGRSWVLRSPRDVRLLEGNK